MFSSITSLVLPFSSGPFTIKRSNIVSLGIFVPRNHPLLAPSPTVSIPQPTRSPMEAGSTWSPPPTISPRVLFMPDTASPGGSTLPPPFCASGVYLIAPMEQREPMNGIAAYFPTFPANDEFSFHTSGNVWYSLYSASNPPLPSIPNVYAYPLDPPDLPPYSSHIPFFFLKTCLTSFIFKLLAYIHSSYHSSFLWKIYTFWLLPSCLLKKVLTHPLILVVPSLIR